MWCTFIVPSFIAVTTAMLLLYSDGKMVLWHTEQFCSLDEPTLSIHGQTIHPCVVFSDTFEQSSLKFQHAVKLAQHKFPEIELHRLPVLVRPVQDPSNKEDTYAMDVAIIPGTLPGQVIHTAGTHGVEGYAGAAIQLTFLQLLLQGEAEEEEAAARPTVILVHAVNPYGMKHYRRANEHNVDLNRNGILDDTVWEVLRERHFNKNNYDRFASFLFHLPGPPVAWYSLSLVFLKGLGSIARYGLPALKTAMVAGQYHAPDGIFYGGQQTEASLWRLRDFLIEHTQRQVVTTWIDVHTGLGPMGIDTLLIQNPSGAASLEQWFPGAQHPFANTDAATQVAKGYENVRGLLSDYFEPLLENTWVVTQEFGTIPSIWVGFALFLENAAYKYLPEAEALEWAKCTTKRAFYPQSRAWREGVIRRGIAVLDQAIRRSTILSKGTPA
ncbi:hypothetical protein FisN_2Lh460 [Fistulifera solaris]|uniref:DUF2817 domain-containing protein n=1 Tax=Fistulifera solaris TaxID=1519565 RepID=A0A1Z5JAB3_FISSO|nr:hypothetical protein FisN_2Lh460 [Fistulifera solaris]|eukprot:GAX10930.1 hypothetical protein FisN_2Lh460 [Fistulifera solaris]